MSDPLPLRENPVFLQLLRGGCHASWRNWYRSPAAVGVISTLVITSIFAAGAWYIARETPAKMGEVLLGGAWILPMAVSFLTTLAMILAQSRSIPRCWANQRMLDLVMTPLSSSDLMRGFFWGNMISWGIVVVAVCAISLPCALVGLALGGSAAMGEGFGAGGMLTGIVIYISTIYYLISQSVWAACITFHFATLQRSALTVQGLSLLITVIAAPIAVGAVRMFAMILFVWVSAALNYSPAGISMILIIGGVGYSGGGLLGILLQTVKLAIAIWIYRSARRTFLTRVQRLWEKSTLVGN
jgi:hypothetical protein